MTKQFAEAKLDQMHKAFVAALKDKGNKTDEEIDGLFAVDPAIERSVKEAEAIPLTKDSYGAYLGLVKKDGATAVILWRNGANPVGVLTALFINLGIPLP